MAYGVTEILDELTQHGFEDIDTTQLLRFINDAYYETCSFPYKFLYRTASVTLTPGSGLLNIVDPDGHIVNKILGISNNTGAYALQPIRVDTLTKNFSGYLTQSGRANYYYKLNDLFYTYPVSTSADVFTARYTVTPKELTVGATPIVPIQHRRVITNGALYRAYMMNDDVDIAQYFKKEVSDRTKIMQEDMWVDQYDRSDFVVDTDEDYQYSGQYT